VFLPAGRSSGVNSCGVVVVIVLASSLYGVWNMSMHCRLGGQWHSFEMSAGDNFDKRYQTRAKIQKISKKSFVFQFLLGDGLRRQKRNHNDAATSTGSFQARQWPPPINEHCRRHHGDCDAFIATWKAQGVNAHPNRQEALKVRAASPPLLPARRPGHGAAVPVNKGHCCHGGPRSTIFIARRKQMEHENKLPNKLPTQM
jgi:hypothetical protein